MYTANQVKLVFFSLRVFLYVVKQIVGLKTWYIKPNILDVMGTQIEFHGKWNKFYLFSFE